MESSLCNASLYKALYKQNIYGNVICNGVALGTFKIYQWSFLKVAALKSTKPSIRKTINVMQSLSRVILKVVSETFSKWLL